MLEEQALGAKRFAAAGKTRNTAGEAAGDGAGEVARMFAPLIVAKNAGTGPILHAENGGKR
jgi:hypothetical protein